MATESNQALSIKICSVSAVMPESNPPKTPAKAYGF
jgi:hypothetical protein